MKKFFAVIAFVLVTGMGFAGEYINQLWSVGTSALFYGDPAIDELHETLKTDSYVNLVISGEYGARIQLDRKIDFVGMGYLTLDSYVKGTSSILHLDYGVSGGVRLTPGLGGLILGCEYCTGQRADCNFLDNKTVDEEDGHWSATQWGNGYRFLFEYDFSALITGIAPTLGISFRSVPRGNNFTDRNLSFYIRLKK
ncbi:MAG: hypothetical protein KBT02_10830 [Treponema sp.]|nr:hypothetical protein [Candidatus Treponema caballi]